MPIYEYYCTDCGKEFEKLVRMSEAAAKPECPNCNNRHTEKRLSAFAMSGGSTGQSTASSCGSSGGFS